MTASFDDTPELLIRMQALEAELKRLKRSFAGRTVSAQAYVLSDKGGHPRGWFAISEDGNPEIKLAGSDGSVRSEIVLDSSDAPRITLYDEEGKQRTALQVSDTGEPSMYLWDGSGANIIALRTLADGSCEIVLNGGVEGRLRLATDSGGAARIELIDEGDHTSVAIRSGDGRPAEIFLPDSFGDLRIPKRGKNARASPVTRARVDLVVLRDEDRSIVEVYSDNPAMDVRMTVIDRDLSQATTVYLVTKENNEQELVDRWDFMVSAVPSTVAVYLAATPTAEPT